MGEVLGDVRYLVGTPRGAQPIFTRCPNPDHFDSGRPNFAVYPDGGYCFNCGYHETAKSLALRLGAADGQISSLPPRALVGSRARRRAQSIEPAEVLSQRLDAHYYHTLLMQVLPERRSWLIKRAILPESIRRWKLGHTGSFFTIPVWNGDKLSGFKLRSDPEFRGDDRPKYINQGVGTTTFRPNPGGRLLVVVEGELDALAVAQYGYDTVTTTTGVAGVGRMGWVDKIKKPIILAVDQDEAGERAAARLLTEIPRAHRVRFPGNDITDALQTLPLLERRRALGRWLEG